MSFDLTQKIKIVNPHANNDELYGPWLSIAEACTNVLIGLREKGRTVGIVENGSIVEYWFKSGIQDSDLIKKDSGSTSSENIIQVPSASYVELGILPTSTLSEKRSAISAFLQGYNNQSTDVLFFEIRDNE